LPNNAITVTVKLFGGLRQLVGQPSISVSLPKNATVADLLAALCHDFPELYKKLQPGLTKGYLSTLINGRNARSLSGFDTPLSGGSTIAFLPPVGGG